MMKELAIVLCIILTMTLCGFAQAETRCVGLGTVNAIDPETHEVTETHYWAEMTTEYSNETIQIQVDEETYRLLERETEAEQDHHDNLWYVKAGNWCTGAFNDAVDWIVFWD